MTKLVLPHLTFFILEFFSVCSSYDDEILIESIQVFFLL